MAEEDNAGLPDYLGFVRRRRYPMVVVVVAGLLLAVIIAMVLPAIYNAPAEFRVSRTSLPDAQRNANYVDEYVSNLTRDVMTGENLEPIVTRFDLYPQFGDDLRQRTGMLARDTHVNMVTQKILDQSSGREREIYAGFTVIYDSATPAAAAGVSAALAEIM